jgi:hypothetical protein
MTRFAGGRTKAAVFIFARQLLYLAGRTRVGYRLENEQTPVLAFRLPAQLKTGSRAAGRVTHGLAGR